MKFPTDKYFEKYLLFHFGLLILATILLAVVCFFLWKQIGLQSVVDDSLQTQITNLQNQAFKKGIGQIGGANSSTSDETVEWRTYISPAMGFSVKYPSNWAIQQNQDNLDLKLPDVIYRDNNRSTTFDVRFSVNKDKTLKLYQSTADYADEFRTDPGGPHAFYQKTLSGVEFYFYPWMHQVEGEHYFTLRNGELFEIRYTMDNFYAESPAFYGGMEKTSQYALFHKILETFKFTN
ncbi:MAG: PsbP-related protein [Patescibacteria group bacterium]